MAQSEASALALWFRQKAAEKTGSGARASFVPRDRQLLGEAADSAARLTAEDGRLVRLAAARRFTDFYVELLFVGGGRAIRRARLASVGDTEATGHTILQAVITTALSEAVPA